MSLNRVSSMESWEQGSDDNPAPRLRKLSFSPVDTWVPPKLQSEEPIGSFEVSKAKRICLSTFPHLLLVLAMGDADSSLQCRYASP
jgi:hypothetical protein